MGYLPRGIYNYSKRPPRKRSMLTSTRKKFLTGEEEKRRDLKDPSSGTISASCATWGKLLVSVFYHCHNKLS